MGVPSTVTIVGRVVHSVGEHLDIKCWNRWRATPEGLYNIRIKDIVYESTKEMNETMTHNCPECRNENTFCNEHQKNEQRVFESEFWDGRHNTPEFQRAITDARIKDTDDED